MNKQSMGTKERGSVASSVTGHDAFPLKWKARYKVEKRYKVDDWLTSAKAGDVVTVEGEGNTVLRQGAIVFWQRLTTLNPTTATNLLLTAFSSGTSYVGVSTSTATATHG
jgi:hypothetical protein